MTVITRTIAIGEAYIDITVGQIGPTGDDLDSYIPALYGNYDFSIDITFKKTRQPDYAFIITDVQYTSSIPFITATKISNSTIRITKAAEPFDSTYDYRMKDNQSITYKHTETSNIDFANVSGMYEWHHPDPKYILVSHGFTITNQRSDTGAVFVDGAIMNQYFYWKLEPELAQFTSLIQQEY